jgi:hypothetical protein
VNPFERELILARYLEHAGLLDRIAAARGPSDLELGQLSASDVHALVEPREDALDGAVDDTNDPFWSFLRGNAGNRARGRTGSGYRSR